MRLTTASGHIQKLDSYYYNNNNTTTSRGPSRGCNFLIIFPILLASCWNGPLLAQEEIETVERRSLLVPNQSQQPPRSQNSNSNNNNNNNRGQQHSGGQPRPGSSSSFFAEVEDLRDSSIRTRLGTVMMRQPGAAEARRPGVGGSSSIEHLGPSAADFDRLIERLVPSERHSQQQQQQQQQNIETPADANNRTTMRFFRNEQTFASVVYTSNEPTRRLINCHLVDMERHSSDVALYEAKYDIGTMEVEFRDMMQLIEACTNIARLRRKPFGPVQQNSPKNSQQNSQQQQQQQQQTSLLVVSRPQSQQQQQNGGQHNSLASFQHVMSGALNHELQRLGQPVDDSTRLDLPAAQRARRFAQHAKHAQAKHLVLGEITVAPEQPVVSSGPAAATRNNSPHLNAAPPGKANQDYHNHGPTQSSSESGSKLREALQEITSYDTSDLLSIWRGILPGTNWCGMGDRATSYNDLGFESDIDICCRAHDFCPIRLSAFTSGYGLFNWSFYTRSHCWCDQNFLDCLQQAESPLSSVVMKFYFTIMKTTCLNDQETRVRTTSSARRQSHHELQQPQKQKQLRQHLLESAPKQQGQAAPSQLVVLGGFKPDSLNAAAAAKIPALRQSKVLATGLEQARRRPKNGGWW